MAGEKRSQDQDEISSARTVLVDIEGTTTSISFVKVKGGPAEETGKRGVRDSARSRPVAGSSRVGSIPGSGLARIFPRDLLREQRRRFAFAHASSRFPSLPFPPPQSRPGLCEEDLVSSFSSRVYTSNSTAGYCPRVGAMCRLEFLADHDPPSSPPPPPPPAAGRRHRRVRETVKERRDFELRVSSFRSKSRIHGPRPLMTNGFGRPWNMI